MYKMKCYQCGSDMKYFEDEYHESMGLITMNCDKCDSGFLIPERNPDLIKEE